MHFSVLALHRHAQVAETCQIASKRVRWVIAHAGNENASNMKVSNLARALQRSTRNAIHARSRQGMGA